MSKSNKPHPTIKHVAKKANVSTATVSLVLSNNERISNETKAKVLEIIKELDYFPSRSARDLVSKKTGNIGFILTHEHFLTTEPFYTQIFLGTEFEARENEFYVLLTTISSDFQPGESLPRFIRERSVDGIIVAGKVPDTFLTEIEKYELPTVFVDYFPAKRDFPVIMIDNENGGRLATEHLVRAGHRKIAFIGGDFEHPSIGDRLEGYRRELRKNKIAVNEKLIFLSEKSPVKETGYEGVKFLMESGADFTAIFACNDAVAIGVIQYLKEHSIRIPEEVAVIGFDDVESGLLIDPPLSTVKVPKLEMGIEAMQLIADSLKNKSKLSKKILVPVELIVRQSTEKKV